MSVGLLTLAQAAERLGMSVTTLRRRVAAGALEVMRDGRIVRVDPGEVERYRLANTAPRRGVEPHAPAPLGLTPCNGGPRLSDYRARLRALAKGPPDK